VRRLNPSFYQESQGAFATRVRHEVTTRLALPCSLELGAQTTFPEPPVRINTDVCATEELEWNEVQAWDEFAAYYTSN
jgi:hypothetical protein